MDYKYGASLHCITQSRKRKKEAMLIKKCHLLLLLITLCISSGVLSLRVEVSRVRTDVDRCVDQCREDEEDVSRLFACAARCERKYSPTEQEGVTPREQESSRRELEQCQQRCLSEEHGSRQPCERRCEEQVRQREQEREREQVRKREPEREREREQQRERREEQERQERQQRREREEREQREREREVRDTYSRDPEEEYKGCQQRCSEQPGSQQGQCQTRCQREFREQQEKEHDRRREWEDENDDERARLELQQCQHRCQSEEHGQQQQHCQRHCEQQVRELKREREREQRRERERDDLSRDPESTRREFQQCHHGCQSEERGQQQQQCQRRCEQQVRERERQEREHQGGRRDENHHEPQQEQHYEQCKWQCERQERGQQQQERCKSLCQEQRQAEQRRREREHERQLVNPQRESRGEQERQQRNNPYYFHEQRFQYRVRSQEGHMRVLQRFREKSDLLRGIDSNRLAILEANPNTIVVPHHCDAETLMVVLNGKGIISFVTQEKKESFNMERGDVIRVPAGTTVYLLNQETNEKLQIAKLIQSVNNPGRFREYYAAGNERQSYYRAFSKDILRRSLNTPTEELERLFGGQQGQQGPIRKATQEQLRSLTQHVSSTRKQGKESRVVVNLLSQKPVYNNNFGRFFEACPNNFKQLQDMDVSVSFAEINQGAMMVPHFNSKTSTIVLVLEGSGRIEMACPHVSDQSQESRGRREQSEQEDEESTAEFEKITAQLSPGDVFIIPAGHPVAVVASQNENIRTVGFGINALNNERNFIAGKNNIMEKLDREAMAIAFNVPEKLVERIFSNNPKEAVFVAGPEQSQEQERKEGKRGQSLPSILEIVGHGLF